MRAFFAAGVVVVAVGCGPVVGTGADEGTTGAEQTGGAQSAEASTSSGADPSLPGTVATSLDPGSTGTTGLDTDGSSGDESSTTDPFGCGCPENTPIAFDSVLERGFTPADAIAELHGLALEFYWLGYEGQPTTTLHVAVAYAGGSVEQGPGGEDGCAFLSSPCPDGVVMEVELTLTSDDGWLAWTMPATLEGVVGERVRIHADAGPLRGNAGTLATQPFSDGAMHEIENVDVFGEREYGSDSVYVDIGGWDDTTNTHVELGSTHWY